MLELNNNLLAEIGGWSVLKEARVLVEQGRVREAHQEGSLLSARVQAGEKIHEAQIKLANRVSEVETKCTCVESRRFGRVCPHALAVGVALLTPPKKTSATVAVPVRRIVATPPYQGPKFFLYEDAPPTTPFFQLTILLPLQLVESLRTDFFRVILEVARGADSQGQPFDSALRHAPQGFAVAPEDERFLRVLAQATGTCAGMNAVPRACLTTLFRALAEHPRVWLGKKQRVEISASPDKPPVTLRVLPDGALELVPLILPNPAAKSCPEISLEGSTWSFDGTRLVERRTLPAPLVHGSHRIPPASIPDFLARQLPALEATCEVIAAPELASFCLEVGQPRFEVRLEGALSGLTLEITAHYESVSFPLKLDPEISSQYFPDPRQPLRFWRRDPARERHALAQISQAGFKPARGGGALFSLTQEHLVTRFLANVLPRWKQAWTVTLGERLEIVLKDVDVAEPEFTFRPAGGNDWLGLDLRLTTGGQPIPLAPGEVERWLQTGQSHTRLPNKRVLLVPTEAWAGMREVLADANVTQNPGGSLRVSALTAPYLSEALSAEGFQGRGLTPSSPPDVATVLKPGLWNQLRPYQQEGVTWLATQASRNFSSLLADDMGLGKTLQALTFCSWLRHQPQPAGPILIVCPTSLVLNWQREAARFVPELQTLDLTGPDRAPKFSQRRHFDLLITSYALLRRDLEIYREDAFSLVILDEAQHIKNRSSQNAQAAKALRAKHRLILTGTPLENSILDLWSLFDFLQPGYLGTAQEFRERYETPLSREQPPRLLERLRHRVRPFFLRRTKEQVLKDLPPRLEHQVLCELSDEQRTVYRTVLEQGRRDLFSGSGKSGKGRDKIAVLTTLLRLRQVCCHLALLPSDEKPRTWTEPSAKLERTFELIEEARDGGHRVLLFSQFVRMLHLLREEAQRREISFCYLDGATTDRQNEVDRFQQENGVPLFLISLKAGGTGLNLTGADTVIHFDPWWNPAVEDQATARAHRLGQARTVQSYKLIAAGTVEEKIQALQARKKEIFSASVGGDEAFAESLSVDELEALLAD